MEIFSEKTVIQKSWSAKKFSVPPKLGARSPPLLLRDLTLPILQQMIRRSFLTSDLVCRFRTQSECISQLIFSSSLKVGYQILMTRKTCTTVYNTQRPRLL